MIPYNIFIQEFGPVWSKTKVSNNILRKSKNEVHKIIDIAATVTKEASNLIDTVKNISCHKKVDNINQSALIHTENNMELHDLINFNNDNLLHSINIESNQLKCNTANQLSNMEMSKPIENYNNEIENIFSELNKDLHDIVLMPMTTTTTVCKNIPCMDEIIEDLVQFSERFMSSNTTNTQDNIKRNVNNS